MDNIIGGVIQNNNAMYLHEEFTNAIILNYDEALNEHVVECEDEDCIANEHQNFTDTLYIDSHDWLIGFKQSENKDECWYWFDNLKYGYLPDEEAEFSAIVGEIYTQVVKSKFVSMCAMCSPCYPNQGDLDTEGSNATYQLPPDIFDNEYNTHLPIIPINLCFEFKFYDPGTQDNSYLPNEENLEGKLYEFCQSESLEAKEIKELLNALDTEGKTDWILHQSKESGTIFKKRNKYNEFNTN